MKMFKKIVSVAMCIVMILGMANVSFAESAELKKIELGKDVNSKIWSYDDFKENYTEVNELILLKRMKREKINKEDLKLQNLLENNSVSKLMENGYSENDISMIHKYKNEDILNIPDNVLYEIGATMRFNMEKGYHIIKNGETKASVEARWAWNKRPIFTGKDCIAFYWGKEFSSRRDKSYIDIEWVNDEDLVLSRKRFDIDKKFANNGCTFKFGIAPHTGITRGIAHVEIANRDDKIYDFEVISKYAHQTFPKIFRDVAIYKYGIDLGTREETGYDDVEFWY